MRVPHTSIVRHESELATEAQGSQARAEDAITDTVSLAVLVRVKSAHGPLGRTESSGSFQRATWADKEKVLGSVKPTHDE
jgi:hypothetical protein